MDITNSQVMNFIRRDGRAGSPVCFLTTEDGGANGSAEDFFDYIGSSGIWEPGTKRRGELGKPGDCISKIMSGLLFGDLSQAANYRDFAIYLANEWNLKFYPIGRPNVADWQDYYSTAPGMEQHQYRSACNALRPSIISDRYGEHLEQSRLVIILSSRPEWLSVLRKKEVFSFETYEVEKHPKGPWKWAFYFRSDGSLAFAYFGMFVWGVTDEDRLKFSKLLRRYMGSSLNEILPNMISEFESSIPH